MRKVKFLRFATVVASGTAALFWGCSDKVVTTEPDQFDAPVSMVVISGNSQVGRPNQELTNPLVVRVVRTDGTGVAGQIVNWRVLSGGGEPYAGVSQTDANGYARERWTLGSVLGEQRIEARAVNPTTGERLSFGTFTATASNQIPVGSVAVTPTTASVAAGSTTRLTATVRDANGVIVTDRAVTWTSSNTAIATVDATGLVRGVVAGTATITATSEGQSASATVTVTSVTTPPPEPTPTGLLFNSDFSTALGNTDAALRDTSKRLPFTSIRGNGRMNEVVRSTGLDFPTANVLKVTTGTTGASQTHRVDNGIAIPAVGQSQFYRWYIRVTVPNTYTADNLTHPMQDALSNTNWEYEVVTHTNGTWTVRWNVSSANSWPLNRWEIVGLNKNQTYRFEFQVRRLTTTTYNLHVRVYNSADVLLYDDDDVRNTARTLTLAQNPTLTFANVNELAGMNAGFNGLAGTSSDMPFTLYYQSGFCIRNDTWCGRYNGTY